MSSGHDKFIKLCAGEKGVEHLILSMTRETWNRAGYRKGASDSISGVDDYRWKTLCVWKAV